jgi:DNA-binding MarR family transcriptional regulator
MSSPSDLRQRAVDAFWEVFPPFWNTVRAYIRHTAAEQFEITFEQFHILRHIRKGYGSVKELAQAKQISRPAISQAVDILVIKGLIVRSPDLQDRRQIELLLTAQGDLLLDDIFTQVRGWMTQRFSILSDDELECLTEGLQTLQKVIDE